MISRHTGIAVAVAFGLTVTAGTHAADLQPVDSVLTRLVKRDTVEAKGLSPAATLMKDIVAFRTRSAQLAAPVAAAEWLALWDRSLAIDAKRVTTDYDAYDAATGGVVGPRSLLAALPAPEAWPAIRAQGRARAAKAPDDVSALGLRLLAEVLTRDTAAARQSVGVRRCL